MADGLTGMRELNLPLQWYTRRDGVTRGPFSENEITRHFLLGRICMNDELSQDRVAWTSANDCTELLPSELQTLSSWDDYQQLVIARMKVDERRGERRCQQCTKPSGCTRERRTHADRRGKDNDRLVGLYLFGRPISSGIHATSGKSIRPLLLTMLLAAIVFAWLVPSQR